MPAIPDTVSLIGMPGCGKSSVGVVLAKLAAKRFVDTDLDIQRRENATLQEILERSGYRYLREVEEQVLLAVPLQGAVIATGGSVVYSDRAMQRLRGAGPAVYLEADLDTLVRRVESAPPRGIASDPALAYAEVFRERTPLYRAQADIVIDATAGGTDIVAARILAELASTA